MNGIKMSDCKFYTDSQTRTVVCVIPETKYMVYQFINDNFKFQNINFNIYNNKLYDALLMPNSFKGKAVCAEEDTWDEELGRMIAFSRAKEKCYHSFFKRMKKYANTIDFCLEDMITTINDFCTKIFDKQDELEAKIEEKLQKE